LSCARQTSRNFSRRSRWTRMRRPASFIGPECTQWIHICVGKLWIPVNEQRSKLPHNTLERSILDGYQC
jgi:hypothetical protein